MKRFDLLNAALTDAGRLELEPWTVKPNKAILHSFILSYRRVLSKPESDKSDTGLRLKVTAMCHFLYRVYLKNFP